MPRTTLALALVALAAFTVSASAQIRGGTGGLRPPTDQQANTNEQARTVQTGTAQVLFPFSSAPQTVTYEVRNGKAIFEGDIVLGSVDSAGRILPRPARPAEERAHDGYGTTSSPLTVINDSGARWPDGVIPYEAPDPAIFGAANAGTIQTAINTLNAATNLTLRVRNGEPNFVRFRATTDNACGSSPIGMQQGQANTIELNVGNCSLGGIQHEILHSAGAFHEQARSDRDSFVTILTQNVEANRGHNFEKRDGVDIGAYDIGSIMHYWATAFGRDGPNNTTLTTIQPVNPNATYNLQGRNCVATGTNAPPPTTPTHQSIMGQRRCLSYQDIIAINALYPHAAPPFEGGAGWRSNEFATDIALGDIDGDGRDEIVVTRTASTGRSRVLLYDDSQANYRLLWEFGAEWGSGNNATAVAFGNVDADAAEELVIGRNADENARVWVVHRASAGTFHATPIAGTVPWGSGNYATDVALGDIDGDGRDEIAVTRRTNSNERVLVYDDADTNYRQIARDQEQWATNEYATAAAFGDVNGDGREELAIGRVASRGPTYTIYRLQGSALFSLRSGGQTVTNQLPGTPAVIPTVTDLAFGQFDGDRAHELVIATNARTLYRYVVLDDASQNYRQIFGGAWGTGYSATAVAFGDVDRDGRHELAVGRNTYGDTRRARYWIIDDAAPTYLEMGAGGAEWGGNAYVTGIAIGDVNGDGCGDLGVARYTDENMRFAVKLTAVCLVEGRGSITPPNQPSENERARQTEQERRAERVRQRQRQRPN